MTYFTDFPTTPARPSAARGLLAELIHDLADTVRAAIRRRRTAAELSQLDDRLLSDIGLTRGEIADVARTLAGAPAKPAWAGLAEALRYARARNAAIRDLERLPDWTLRDIGIPRHEIRVAAERIAARNGKTRRRVRTPAPAASPVHEIVHRVEAAARPLLQWQLSRVAAGQLARLDRETLADLGYVKGDVDWVPEILAKRTLDRAANRNLPRADVA